jgi:hypothetical protein
VDRCKTGVVRHIRETTVAVVAQQRVRILALLPEPPSAKDEHIDVPIVVIVGLFEVGPTEETVATAVRGDVTETPVAEVFEVPHRAAGVPRRREDVEVAVSIEVLRHRRAAEIHRTET